MPMQRRRQTYVADRAFLQEVGRAMERAIDRYGAMESVLSLGPLLLIDTSGQVKRPTTCCTDLGEITITKCL